MPRGPVGGATAALIKAAAERGVKISPYQIERWRAAGELPRPVRHGRGRGRGAHSEPPDEQTVDRAILLAGASRQGARRFGSHPVERLAQGLPLSDDEVRRVVDDSLTRVGRLLGAELGSGDRGWQARNDLARRAKPIPTPQWGDLLDAAEKRPARPEPSTDRVRAGFEGMTHVIAGDGEASPDDVIDFLGASSGLSDEAVEDMRRQSREAELRGDTNWTGLVEAMSLNGFRLLAGHIDPDQWRRALPVFLEVTTHHMFVSLLGVLAVAGTPVELSEVLRIDAQVIKEARADPMWKVADVHLVKLNSKYRTELMVLGALGIITTGQLAAWEQYRDRLHALLHPSG